MYDGKILWGDNTDEKHSVKTCAYSSYKWELLRNAINVIVYSTP